MDNAVNIDLAVKMSTEVRYAVYDAVVAGDRSAAEAALNEVGPEVGDCPVCRALLVMMVDIIARGSIMLALAE